MDSVTRLNLHPAGGRQVRKEDGSVIPDKGCEVPNNRYYRRRLNDGDLELVAPEKPSKPVTTKGEK